MKFYLVCSALLAFIAMECIGLYWMTTGSLPPLLARVDPTVLWWVSMGVMAAAIWALVSMMKNGLE